MDVEKVDEDPGPEPEEREDRADPADRSAEAHDARVNNSLARPSADAVAKHDVTHVPIEVGVRSVQPPVQEKIPSETSKG